MLGVDHRTQRDRGIRALAHLVLGELEQAVERAAARGLGDVELLHRAVEAPAPRAHAIRPGGERDARAERRGCDILRQRLGQVDVADAQGAQHGRDRADLGESLSGAQLEALADSRVRAHAFPS
ncbi:hypothetical protein GCM10025869_18420 [Homoserinibacter gongjuensis]|uniref:Uncharacterized protein n=1 Tax=Homoserinibacter gongjuensis TaxID=1162968 RepID=A0ABQ6JT34_9MICO|nr:hypothetical protein GCM10025869_18420 [Homoserinibacter gongjuensis]